VSFKSLFNKLVNKFNWNGKSLNELFISMFSSSKKKIENKILQDTFKEYKKAESKLGKINLPNTKDFLSSEAKLVKLSKFKGKEINDNLKQKIKNDLIKTIEEDKKSLTFNELLDVSFTDRFKSKLSKTLNSYNSKDKDGLSKLESIALTESRNVVNSLKYNYALAVANNNRNIIVTKMWKHYPYKSKFPRKGHAEKDKESIDIRSNFIVNYYVLGKNKKQVKKGTDVMRYPHDSNSDSRQIVNCHCDIFFSIERK